MIILKSCKFKNMGRNNELTEQRVLDIMRDGNRPVWTASNIAERAGVARSTATKRIKNLAESEKIETIQVGNATAYYLVGIKTKPLTDSPDQETPSVDEIIDKFSPCEPYTVADLQDDFEDCSRWTIVDRLNSLVEDGHLQKKTHADQRVSYLLQG